MGKNGWKSVKNSAKRSVAGSKSSVPRTNRLPRTAASSKLGKGRRREKDPSGKHARSAETINRLKMYVNGKPIRNKKGEIVAGQFMMGDRAGDRKIDASTGRIAPDRRWFGNTRVVSSNQLDKFREEMTEKVADPYSVVLKRKKLPMGLLQDASEFVKTNKSALLEQEGFQDTFGSKSKRKRVKLDQLLLGRSHQEEEDKQQQQQQKDKEGYAEVVKTRIEETKDDDDDDDQDFRGDVGLYKALLTTAESSHEAYEKINTREGIVPWGRDSNLERKEGEGVDWFKEKKDDLFLKGQSKRIWGEFFKVVDCSDVVLHVVDARNVPGTRCTMIEKHIAENAKHKHLVFVLNKVDLVPNWVAKRWMGELARDRPTIAFHASITQAFGKGALIALLRQFGKLHEDKKQISVGVIGYPNVGKSSVINTLISKKGCKVAPIPGETKIWQFVTLFKRISLIDCPGVVVDTAGDTEEDSVLKGVVRAERLENPEDFVDAIRAKVRREHIAAQYKLPKDGEGTWTTSIELMELIARRSGRLLKGGEPCLRTAAIMLIQDFQRGRLPHYVAPPELKEEDKEQQQQHEAQKTKDDVVVEEQDLDALETKVPQDEKDEPISEDNNNASESEDEEKGATTTATLIGSGQWDD